MGRKRSKAAGKAEQRLPQAQENHSASALPNDAEAASLQPAVTAPAAAPWQRPIVWGLAGLLFAAVLLVFGQTAGYEFVNYDDQQYVYQNPHVTAGVTDEGIAWAATERYEGNWHPLTWLSHMIDWHIFGEWAGGHHLTSVLLHGVSAVLLFFLLVRTTGQIWVSAFATALFAIHPLRVESVAWVAERKDVLSGLLFLLVLWAYVLFVTRPFSWSRYAAVVGLFALGLAAKPMLVTTPLVLLLLDFWPLKRVRARNRPARDTKPGKGKNQQATPKRLVGEPWQASLGELIVEKLPLAALSALSCAITVWAQQSAIVTGNMLSFPQRIANAVAAYASYVTTFFFPWDLAVFYPYSLDGIPPWRLALSLLLLVAVSAWAVIQRRKRPYLLIGWLWFVGMLVPVIGLVQVGSQWMADRYTYLPQVGLAIACAFVAGSCLRTQRQINVAKVLAAVILAVLMVAAFRQTQSWQNSEVLWQRALQCAPENDRADYSLGAALHVQGRLDDAVKLYEKALKLNPSYFEARQNAATAYFDLGQPEKAYAQLKACAEANPTRVDALIHLGDGEVRLGRAEDALKHYRQAVELCRTAANTEPAAMAAAQNSLGIAMMTIGRPEEAALVFQDILARDPKNAMAELNLGNALLQQGKAQEAANHFGNALLLKPDTPVALHNLAYIKQSQGQAEEAISLYESAVRIQPDYFDAYCHLGTALESRGRIDEAIASLQKGLAIRPDNPDANLTMARLLSESGRVAEARPYLERGMKAQTGNPAADVLSGNLLLQQKRWAEAIEHFQKFLKSDAKNPLVHWKLGNAFEGMALKAAQEKNPKAGEYFEQARASYQKAVELDDKKNVEMLDNLARVCLPLGRLQEAVDTWKKAVELKPADATLRYHLGTALFQQGQTAEALVQWRESNRLAPGKALVLNKIAEALYKQGETDEALTQWRESIRLTPDQALVLNKIAEVLYKQGQVAEAVATWQKAIRLLPPVAENATLLNNMAWILATNADAKVRNGKEAIKLAEQADKLLGGKNPVVLSTLAAAYAEDGRFDKAVETARRAQKLAADLKDPGSKELAESLKKSLQSYQDHKPWRDPKAKRKD